METVRILSLQKLTFILLLISTHCTHCYTFATFFSGGPQYPQFFYAYNTFYPHYVEYEQIYPPLYQMRPQINYKGVEETPQIGSKPVVIEVTKVVTVNPVCFTVKDGTPPCYHNHVIIDGEYGKLNTRIENTNYGTDDNVLVVTSNNKNMLIEGELEVSKRTPELKKHKVSPKVIRIESKDAYIIKSESILNTHPNKKLGRTRGISANTIWKTITQKISEYGVTATLVVNNCVPNELVIPKCVVIKEASEDAKHEMDNDTEEFDIDIRFG